MSANDQNGCEGMNKEEEKLEGQKNKQTNVPGTVFLSIGWHHM